MYYPAPLDVQLEVADAIRAAKPCLSKVLEVHAVLGERFEVHITTRLERAAGMGDVVLVLPEEGTVEEHVAAMLEMLQVAVKDCKYETDDLGRVKVRKRKLVMV
jgi:hypothetical protein